jgi:hypothetical protein
MRGRTGVVFSLLPGAWLANFKITRSWKNSCCIWRKRRKKTAIRNVQEVITSVKHKRNGEAKAALNILTSSVSGKNIFERKGAVNSLAKKLGVNCRILQIGILKLFYIQRGQKVHLLVYLELVEVLVSVF